MSLLHPRIIRDLELDSLGLQVLPANDLFCPLGGNDYIVFSDDVRKTQAEFARFSRHDAEIYPQFARYLEESAAVVRQLLFETPVDPVDAAGRASAGVPRCCGGIARSAIAPTGWSTC